MLTKFYLKYYAWVAKKMQHMGDKLRADSPSFGMTSVVLLLLPFVPVAGVIWLLPLPRKAHGIVLALAAVFLVIVFPLRLAYLLHKKKLPPH